MCQILGVVASARLKQDGQDAQDAQDEFQVRKDLHVYSSSRKQEDKVREDLNLSIGGGGACEGQALALRASERAFFGAGEGQALAIAPSSWPS